MAAPAPAKNIPQDELEAMVVNSVADLLLEPDLLEQIADAIVELQQAEAARPDPEKQALGKIPVRCPEQDPEHPLCH